MTERIQQWTERVTRVLAPNPGLMRLEGTNSYVVRAPGARSSAVVDPGPPDEEHLARLRSLGDIELVLVTHRHLDHAEAAAELAASVGAPVRAVDPDVCREADPLQDGEVIVAGGGSIRVVVTPGHTQDSACFVVEADARLDGAIAAGSLLTGDTILGRGSTLVAEPDGSLETYLRSLTRLLDYGTALVLPGHGPIGDTAAAMAASGLRHRRERLDQVSAALGDLGRPAAVDDETVADVAAIVYAALSADLRSAAERSTREQLRYLMSR